MSAIHQFIPSLGLRDAIGTHTLKVQDLLRSHAFDSEIFAADVHTEIRRRARHYREFKTKPGCKTWLLYQASTGSDLAEFLLDQPLPKIVNYHNVTPSEFFEAWEPAVALELEFGRRQVRAFAGRAGAIAVSEHNKWDLLQMGYTNAFVSPVLVDAGRLGAEVDERTLTMLNQAKESGGADWLFVGRLSPNKAQHDLIKAFSAYRTVYDPKAHLYLVGTSSSESYRKSLHAFTHALGLSEAISFTGSLSDSELAAYYKASDVFVCCSDHEGFCVPLLEAMHFGVPIVAYGAAAVRETVDGAGVLLEEKGPAAMSAAVHHVLADHSLKDRLVEQGKARAAEFSIEKTSAMFLAAIKKIITQES